MMKLAACAVVLVVALQDPKTPDLFYNKEQGISIQKPPKLEEWEFKSQCGIYKECKVNFAHRVDDIGLHVFFQEPEAGKSFDTKQAAEAMVEGFTKDPNLKDVKKGDLKTGKMPGNGAGGVNAWCLDATLKNKADKSYEIKVWSFVGRENQCLYRVFLWGEPGLYKKHQRVLDAVIGSLKIWKLPKK